MFRPRVIPVLLLKGKGLVKTVRFKNPKYIGDPINAVRIFNDLKADELVFLDITATIENRCISPKLIKDIGDEAFMPFAAGGGIKTVDEIRELFSSGAEKVVINTQAYKNIAFVEKAASEFGNQSIIISIDIKRSIWGDYNIFVKSGTQKLNISLIQYIKDIVSAGAGEILVNSIDHDGMMQGYDLTLIKEICQNVKVPVIACGGAGTLEHLRQGIKIGGASAVAAGSMFVYHGPRKAVLINYPDKNELINQFY